MNENLHHKSKDGASDEPNAVNEKAPRTRIPEGILHSLSQLRLMLPLLAVGTLNAADQSTPTTPTKDPTTASSVDEESQHALEKKTAFVLSFTDQLKNWKGLSLETQNQLLKNLKDGLHIPKEEELKVETIVYGQGIAVRVASANSPQQWYFKIDARTGKRATVVFPSSKQSNKKKLVNENT